MASKQSERLLQSLTRRTRPRYTCANSGNYAKASRTMRQLSTTVLRSDEQEQEQDRDQIERPRWSYTPEQMKAPFNPRIKDPRKAWKVNEDPRKLDDMYIGLLGKNGDKILSEEIKWLAVTHKSYDQGRRGFNDRLAFLGKRLLVVQANSVLLRTNLSPETQVPMPDPYDRTPFQHSELNGLPNLLSTYLPKAIAKERLARLAISHGIGDVTRWKPKNPANLQGSGSEVIFSISLFAILGAIALQKGSYVADKMAREKILRPLGM